jgi:hypothetical protein
MQKCVSQLSLNVEQIAACECVLMHPVDVTDFHRRGGKLNFSFVYFTFEWLAEEFYVNFSCTVCGKC